MSGQIADGAHAVHQGVCARICCCVARALKVQMATKTELAHFSESRDLVKSSPKSQCPTGNIFKGVRARLRRVSGSSSYVPTT